MFRLIILCSIAVTSLAQEDFFKKYAFTKVMTNCFGDELYYKGQAQIADAAKQCMQQPVFITGMPSTVNIPYVYPVDVGGQSVYVPVQSYIPRNQGVTYYYTHRRTRQASRQPIFDAATLEGYKIKVESALSNFTCVLRRLDYIDDNLSLNLQNSLNYYNAAPIDDALRNDLIEGINYCSEVVSCLPLHRLKSPVPEALQRLVLFTKCERKLRLGACFKHDLRQNLNEFDTSPLANIGGSASTVDKLMAILIGEDAVDDELELL